MAVKVSELCDGIAETLAVAAGIESWTKYNKVTEGIAVLDCPRLEVHPDRGTTDPSGNTDRTTFGAGVQQTAVVILADLYARRRSQLSDDLKVTVDMIDAISDELESQERPPFFGLAYNDVKAFSWSWRRLTFIRAKALYMGARFTITCRVF